MHATQSMKNKAVNLKENREGLEGRKRRKKHN